MFNRLPSISKQYFSQSRVNPFRFAFPLIPTNLSPSNFYFKQMTTSSTTNLSDIEDLNQSCGFKRAELLDETISCADSVVRFLFYFCFFERKKIDLKKMFFKWTKINSE